MVGWNDNPAFQKPDLRNESKKDRNKRLKRISDLDPDTYAKSVMGGITRRVRSRKLGADPTYDDFV